MRETGNYAARICTAGNALRPRRRKGWYRFLMCILGATLVLSPAPDLRAAPDAALRFDGIALGPSGVELTVSWPTDLPGALELYCSSNSATTGFRLLATNLSTAGRSALTFLVPDPAADGPVFCVAGDGFTDTDADGLCDARELVLYGCDPFRSDTDGDGVRDASDTQPCGAADTDGDGLPDDWERRWFPDLDQSGTDDPDGDGVCNAEERAAGTDPTRHDLASGGPSGVGLVVFRP